MNKVADAMAGDWLIIRRWGVEIRQIERVTPKLFKLKRGSYPSQISHADRAIVASATTKEEAERLRDCIAGIDGEFNRRRKAADDDRNARVRAAEDARAKAVAQLLSRQTEKVDG